MNGWNYPVAGASARGIGAVQQFFECLGLSRPPAVELSEREITFDCRSSAVQTGQVTLRTSARKWVYGEAESSVPWMRVITPSVSGSQKAVLAFEIDPAQLTDSRVCEGSLRVRANGGQRLEMIVRVNDFRPERSAARAPEPARLETVPTSTTRPERSAAPAPEPARLETIPTNITRPERSAPPAPWPGFLDEPLPASTFSPEQSAAPAPGPGLLEAAGPVRAHRPRPAPPGRLLSPVLALALVFLCGRLLLALPADLFARLLAPQLLTPPASPAEEPTADGKDSRLAEWLVPGDRSLAPGSLQRWLHAPGSRLDPADPNSGVVDEGFLKLFVLATWWVGALVGLHAVWRKGGHLGDLWGGLIAGAGAGLAISATLGCLLLLGDALPRMLLRLFAGLSLSTVSATLLWLTLVAISYTLWGVLAGFVLVVLGPTGRRIQALLAAPLAALVRTFGAVTAAEFLAPER